MYLVIYDLERNNEIGKQTFLVDDKNVLEIFINTIGHQLEMEGFLITDINTYKVKLKNKYDICCGLQLIKR